MKPSPSEWVHPDPLIIVHTEASRSWGGQGIRILNESLWMRARGHRLVIIAPEDSRLMQEARGVGLETYAVPFTKKTQVRDLFRLMTCLRRIAPDILNTHSSVDTWVGCLAGRGCRVPAVIRTRHFGVPVRPHLLNRWLYNSLCHHVFTTGDSISRALIADLGLTPHRVSTIPTGIRPPDLLPAPAEARAALITALGLPSEARFIGCLAVLRRGKGHTVLLDAFRTILEKVPNHYLLMIGEGSSRRALDATINAWGLQKRVYLTGYRPDPWFVLRALDVKVLASISHEGTPQAILQAQFAGCPVIGSDVGGITDVIAHEQTGLLVPRGEVEPLGNALLRLIEDRNLAAFLSRNAQRYVRAHHTLEMMGNKILSVYHELLTAH